MDYKYFYIAIRRYAKRKITLDEFIVDWGYAQSRQGIKPKKQKIIGRKLRGWV